MKSCSKVLIFLICPVCILSPTAANSLSPSPTFTLLHPQRRGLGRQLEEGEEDPRGILEAFAREGEHHACEDALDQSLALGGDELLDGLSGFGGGGGGFGIVAIGGGEGGGIGVVGAVG